MIKNTTSRKIFSNNLRYYRIKNKMTQSELAEKSGLTDKYISDLERGLYSTNLDTLDEIAIALNVDTYKLIKFDATHTVESNRLDVLTGTRKRRKV